jgi:magnesium transporter
MITIVEYEKTSKKVTVHNNVDWRSFQSVPENLYWWDLKEATEDESACLADYFHFHPLAIEDCISDIHHPKLDYYESYLYLVVHGVDVDLTKELGFAPKELDVFLSNTFLVTYHIKPMRSVGEVLRRASDKSPILEYGTDFVLYTILDVMINNYLPVLETIEEQLDECEDLLFANPTPDVLRRILNLKRTLMRLRRTVLPQREVINHLARSEYEFIQPKTQAYFRDVYDQIYRMAEMTESFRDLSTALVETYLSTVSNRLNEVMKLLTLFATIFMSLSVITGIYGMNFHNIPELSWKYGYFFTLGLMGVVVIVLMIYFKHKKWM